MRLLTYALALAAIVGLGAASAQTSIHKASPAKASTAAKVWVGSWGASPLAPNLVAAPLAPISAHFANQTVRQVVRLSAGGSAVRLRLTNEFGSKPLEIGEVHVALTAGPGGVILPGTDHLVTFSRARSAAIAPGAPLVSDPVEMILPPLTSVTVSLYLPSDTGPCTCHQVAAQTGYAAPGNVTAADRFPAASTFVFRAFLSGVDVLAAPGTRALVAFGDSLTDGAASTTDANHRWPDRLAERLDAKGSPWGVVNQGISGNQLLADGAGASGLARFDRDVLTTPGASAVLLMLGTNDLGIGYGPARPGRAAPTSKPPTVEDIQAADRQLIARAHGRGLKIFAATLPPFEGAGYWSPAGDTIREAVNDWIRKGGEFDGVLDFDAVWRDPSHPARIKPGFNAPDHLHGSDAGYAALGDAVDLSLFK
jgi:lysophospholipase L1-like esterase